MKDISQTVRTIEGQVMEEVDGVKEYLKEARDWKTCNKDISKMYYDIAVQELEHAKKLHSMLTHLETNATPEEKHLIDFMKSLNEDQIFMANLEVNLQKS